jgi:hypothetical protein
MLQNLIVLRCQGFTLITFRLSMDYLGLMLPALIHMKEYVFYFDLQS